jgi:hypothetical protein
MQDLDRHDPADLHVKGLVDDAHPARRDLADELVPTVEQLPDERNLFRTLNHRGPATPAIIKNVREISY